MTMITPSYLGETIEYSSLHACRSTLEDPTTTSLLTKANLSHSRLSKFLDNLTGAGLINKIEYDGKNTFVITSKGRQYLDSYINFSSIAESFGLEL